jgi:hypothetical protein
VATSTERRSFPNSPENLKLLVLLSCRQNAHRAEWQKKFPSIDGGVPRENPWTVDETSASMGFDGHVTGHQPPVPTQVAAETQAIVAAVTEALDARHDALHHTYVSSGASLSGITPLAVGSDGSSRQEVLCHSRRCSLRVPRSSPADWPPAAHRQTAPGAEQPEHFAPGNPACHQDI